MLHCSEFPMDTLDLPPAAADQVLTPWQAQHAVLVLKAVPQLQDLRFVLCPRWVGARRGGAPGRPLCRRAAVMMEGAQATYELVGDAHNTAHMSHYPCDSPVTMQHLSM